MSKYFLGVDGGGSKTTAEVRDENGTKKASCTGDSINYYSVGLEKARAAMSEIIACLGIEKYEGAVIGMSALAGRATEKELHAFADGIINAGKIYMDSDLFVALEALNAPGECAVVISGTGSMSAKRNEDGTVSTAGGYGYILGDEGSGYDIGLNGIKAAIACSEGYGEQTVLLEKCLEFFGITKIPGLIDVFYGEGVERKRIAAFGTEVRLCAADGDKAAKAIIENAARALAKQTLSLISKSDKNISVGLWGGIFQHCAGFREIFRTELNKNGFGRVGLLEVEPHTGAVLAAMKMCGVKITEDIYSEVKQNA